MPFRRPEPLFCEGDTIATFDQHRRNAVEAVNHLDKDRFLGSSEEQLVEHFVAEWTIDPLALHEDRAEMIQEEARIDVAGWPGRDWGRYGRQGPLLVQGTRVTVTIPYTGDPKLWRLRPSNFRLSFPRASVLSPQGEMPGTLVVQIEQPTDVASDAFKHALDSTLCDIRFYIEQINKDVDGLNRKLPNIVRDTVRSRCQSLEKHEGLSALLNIPLRRREGAPTIQPIRVNKRITKPLPPPPRSGLTPEPGITDDTYEAVLQVVRHEGRTFETTPRTYAVHDEEELRDIMLAHLNGHFVGNASGETFRRVGKTDIRIEDHERAAFVAECKVWRGAKELDAAVSQLLSYLTWRDCKASLIVFNKQVAGFSDLLEKLPAELAKHRLLLKNLGPQGPGEWRYRFRSQEDPGRQVTVHVFLFNVHISKEGSAT